VGRWKTIQKIIEIKENEKIQEIQKIQEIKENEKISVFLFTK